LSFSILTTFCLSSPVFLGKLGLGDISMNRLVPTIVETLKEKNIIKIASMSTYCLALNPSGAVYIWGSGGSIGSISSAKADITPQLLDALPPKVKIIDISCGLGHALFLTSYGKIFSWGNGGNGRLGLNDLNDRTEACLISSLTEETITAVTCGASHSLALTQKGWIYSWGKNTQGQCGHGHLDDTLKPTLVKKLTDKAPILQIAAGWEHSLVLSFEGKMYSWGCGYKDNRRQIIPPVLGLGHSDCKPAPELISSIESVKIIGIVSGWDHCMALDSDRKLLSWGSGQNG
jgi:E3 ubiquitin-protein ligase HERC2